MGTCDNCVLSGDLTEVEIHDEALTICEPCTTLFETHSIQISPLRCEDLELILAWRSNPTIYRHFRNQDGPLDWEVHKTWFNSRNDKRRDFIIHFQDRRVGVVNINADNEVGILLGDFSARGQGIATATLNWLCDRFAERGPLIAEINKENTQSIELFERCGFEQDGCDDGWLRYIYEP